MLYKILERYPELVVVLKPSGMLSVPARDVNDPRPVLGRLLEYDLKQQIFPVHRLDFEVAGIMLYALSASMHKILSVAFEEHKILKTYFAIAENHSVFKAKQEWKSLLLKGKKRTYEASFGKPSLTFAEVLENYTLNGKNISKWRLNPFTGRSHQLRYEMLKHGHTILGDKLYGSKFRLSPNQIALISYSIDLPIVLTQSPYNLPETLKLSPEQINQLLPSDFTLDI